jgi:hypothetical protein
MDLSNVTDDELKEAWEQLKANAKNVAARKAFSKEFVDSIAVWQTIITKEKRPMENEEFTLCQRCVVENSDDELPPLE